MLSIVVLCVMRWIIPKLLKQTETLEHVWNPWNVVHCQMSNVDQEHVRLRFLNFSSFFFDNLLKDVAGQLEMIVVI